jgi:DEAD/DEAH box helicase domain-containing protein
MGIDVGDLSAAVLCSVAPSPSNYLQRVGRAGRKTGNAFCLTLANSRPHDLYFFDEPREMIAGQVLPPGCFLNAPEMLRRQLVAHAMDAWARDETEVDRIPPQTGFILGKGGGTKFPGRFLEYFKARQAELTASFLSLFEGELSEENRKRLEEFAGGQTVPELVREAFDRVRREINDLRAQGKKIKQLLKQIELNPELFEDPETEKQELETAHRVLGRLVVELRHKYPLNLLCDEGVLPNYAFPEPGVRLESVVGEPAEGGGMRYEAREYLRPASTAIRELAPFNTFYADGRKVKVDEVDVGTSKRPLLEGWRLCPDCNHAGFETTAGGEDGKEPDAECPRCGSLGWPDAGQLRKMLHFRRSRSLANRLAATTADDTEDREVAYRTTDTFGEEIDYLLVEDKND